MWQINNTSTYHEILWSRLRNNHNRWYSSQINRFSLVKTTNRICWSITCTFCNNNLVKLNFRKGWCYIIRNYTCIKKCISLWFCSTIRKRIGYICWIWRKSIIRRSKTKNSYCKSSTKKTKYIITRLSNFSLG